MNDHRLTVSRDSDNAILAKYRRFVADPGAGPISPCEADLIPAADIPKLAAAINASLTPATNRQVAEFLAMIAGAWPYQHQRLDPTALDLHVRQMSEDMAQFPADILVDTVREVRRTLKFAPSIAELYEVASEMYWRRRIALQAIGFHKKAHERFAAERQCVADREADARARTQRRHESLVRHHGTAMAIWSVHDLETATDGIFQAGLDELRHFFNGIESGESWIPEVMPVAVAAGVAGPLCRAGNLSAGQFTRVVQIALGGPEAARRVIAEISGPPPYITVEADEARSTGDARQLMGEIIAGMRLNTGHRGSSA